MYQAERKAVNRKLEYRDDSRTIEEDPDAVAIVSAEFAAERPQAANETGRRPKDFAQELPVVRPGSCNQHENRYWLKADGWKTYSDLQRTGSGELVGDCCQ